MFRTMKHKFTDSCFQFELHGDTVSMILALTTSNPNRLNSKLNKVLGFTNTHYSEKTHKSESPVMKTSIDKGHLKCDCVDGSIANGNREQRLFSFNLIAPPGYGIPEELYI